MSEAQRPNIMFLQCEDIGLHLSCYRGNEYSHTPNMDRLASEGARYTQAFSHAPVCAPSRGGMVTGCYPWSIGNHHMRSTLLTEPRMYTHELVDAGYHVSWSTKLDFNFEPTEGWCTDQDQWWEKDAPQEPFFVYENFGETHESQMFADKPAWHKPVTLPDELKHDPAEAPVPPYMHECPEIRTQLAAYYDALTHIDRRIGQRLKWLEDQGKLENTIVILLSDHGRGLPREKRWCYEAGIHLPLIVRWPGMIEAGTVINDLIAWVDVAPTVLSVTGTAIPEHYQGQVFLGEQKAASRDYVFAGRDRMDLVFDYVRCVRDQKWHYIRNYVPELPWAQHQWYMEQQPIMPIMRELKAQGKLQGDEQAFFMDQKPAEELFDIENDPHCMVNLAEAPEHQETLQKMRAALKGLQDKYGDLAQTSEEFLIERGMVVDRFEEYISRNTPLPERHQMGPQPIPTTLNEALAAFGRNELE